MSRQTRPRVGLGVLSFLTWFWAKPGWDHFLHGLCGKREALPQHSMTSTTSLKCLNRKKNVIQPGCPGPSRTIPPLDALKPHTHRPSRVLLTGTDLAAARRARLHGAPAAMCSWRAIGAICSRLPCAARSSTPRGGGGGCWVGQWRQRRGAEQHGAARPDCARTTRPRRRTAMRLAGLL